ncbi:MAG TPA: UGSC family (seleno)protein [Streptosporangiaceae bacterium]|nr:UGSC family (seleno)protein [Streptosporangiaceae bacterium]
MPNAILDPTGRAGAATAAQPGLELAPRRRDLAGARVGLMDNTKHNAALLLAEIGALLAAEHGAAVTVEATKANFAAPAPADLVARYRAACDVVITGVGDCGSCSASAVADGIVFEQSGLPAAVICSDAFVVTADAMAELRGAAGYRYIRTAHPVAVLTPEQVRERAKVLLPEVVALLTSGQ